MENQDFPLQHMIRVFIDWYLMEMEIYGQLRLTRLSNA